MDAMEGEVSGDGMCEDGGDGRDMMADDASHMPAVDDVTAAAIAAGLISVDHTNKMEPVDDVTAAAIAAGLLPQPDAAPAAGRASEASAEVAKAHDTGMCVRDGCISIEDRWEVLWFVVYILGVCAWPRFRAECDTLHVVRDCGINRTIALGCGADCLWIYTDM